MKKISLLLLALIAATPAHAGVTCSLPFNLQNNTVADATQVMANYNALVTCLGNAAAAGANNDITSLSALSTPITLAQGGTPVYVGGASTGTANAQVVGSVSPATFSLTAGKQVTFYAGASNTGPLTLNVASTGATAVYRRTQLGISNLVGGEVIAGHAVTVVYDGTQFQIISIEPVLVGTIINWTGVALPSGFAWADGECQLRTGIYADLFTVIGINYDPTGSTCDSAHFAMPDARGRMLAGRDNMGGSAAGRITTASNCTGTDLGRGCGLQTIAITAQNQLPSANFTVSGITLNDPGHNHDTNFFSTFGGSSSGPSGVTTGSGTSSFANGARTNTTGITISSQGTAASGGTSEPIPGLNPVQIVNKIVKL